MITHPEAAIYHQHYTVLEERRKQAFAAFRQAYSGFPSIFSNCLVYACPTGSHIKKAAEAKEQIKQLGLPLTAQPTYFSTQNAFTVHFVEDSQ